jgi:hypothetical protein
MTMSASQMHCSRKEVRLSIKAPLDHEYINGDRTQAEGVRGPALMLLDVPPGRSPGDRFSALSVGQSM